MLVSSGRLLHRFDEFVREERPRLGRHLELDARSLEHTVENELAALHPPTIKPAEHLPAIVTLDQGRIGACTGNAGAYAVSALYGSARIPAVTLDGDHLSSYDGGMDERFAVELYHDATLVDGLQEPPYPPDDRGSTGLGVCRALKRAGLVGGYQWATTTRGFGLLLQRQGVMMGLPWFEAFFDPDAHGFIDSGQWEVSPIAGGHEVYVEALEAWNDRGPRRSVIRFHNSWSDHWGDHGCGRMTLATYEALIQQVDLKQLVRSPVVTAFQVPPVSFGTNATNPPYVHLFDATATASAGSSTIRFCSCPKSA